MPEKSKLYSIAFNKCPCCHEGNFFETDNPYNLKKFAQMNKYCPVCGTNLEPEQGFYTGAMYVSYALYVALIVTTFVGFVVILEVDVDTVLKFLVPVLIILLPPFFRFARLIWANMFMSYKGVETSTKSAFKR